MNLSSKEKKNLVKAYLEQDYQETFRLFGKAKGVCPTCINISYVKTWMDYWFSTGQLQRQ